jgi:hypothetical protein
VNIPDIVQMAKDSILEHGEHRPELHIEYKDEERAIAIFADFPYKTAFERKQALFVTGRKIGLESKDKEIAQVVFIIEAWVSTQKRGEPRPSMPPSEDPNRKEVLLIQLLEPNKVTHSLKQSLHVVEMLRDGSGKLVDLLHDREEMNVDNTSSNLLTSFLAGFESAKLSDKDFAHILDEAFRKGL